MAVNPASDTLPDPLDYYTNQTKRKRSVGRQAAPDLRGVAPLPHAGVNHKNSTISKQTLNKPPRSTAMDGWLGFVRCLENIPGIGHIVSSAYACAGSKDKAERAGLKATAGLLLCICNFPVEAVDEATAKPSLKLDSPALMQRPDWMRHHKKRQLRHLCLPGSHQSGTYTMHKLQQVPMIEGWSRCQKLSFDAQLYGGIRFLDLRVMSYDGTIWLHHNLVACMPLRDALESVRDFVAEHSTEIVGMHFSNDGKPIDWGLCQSLISEILGEKLIHEHMKDMLIGDIVDQGRNVFVAGVPHVAYNWRSIQYRWPNKPWPDQLREDLDMTLSEISNNRPQSLYWYKAECTPNTEMIVRNVGGLPGYVIRFRGGQEKFEFIEDLACAVNHEVYHVLSGLTRLPFNILSTDYVQDDIVGLIIELNDKGEEGLFTADESQDFLDDVFTETSTLVTSQPHGRNPNLSVASVATASSSRSAVNTSFDIRLKAAPPLEVKETNI